MQLEEGCVKVSHNDSSAEICYEFTPEFIKIEYEALNLISFGVESVTLSAKDQEVEHLCEERDLDSKESGWSTTKVGLGIVAAGLIAGGVYWLTKRR